ncbi:MAG: hypothetical protein H6637_05180 [Ardenticatenales bacterium]|nr:hypothetical protein [Ardenticatenales bacterium]
MARWDDVGATIYENGRAMSVDRILTLLNEYVEGDMAAYELANQTMDIAVHGATAFVALRQFVEGEESQ